MASASLWVTSHPQSDQSRDLFAFGGSCPVFAMDVATCFKFDTQIEDIKCQSK